MRNAQQGLRVLVVLVAACWYEQSVGAATLPELEPRHQLIRAGTVAPVVTQPPQIAPEQLHQLAGVAGDLLSRIGTVVESSAKKSRLKDEARLLHAAGSNDVSTAIQSAATEFSEAGESTKAAEWSGQLPAPRVVHVPEALQKAASSSQGSKPALFGAGDRSKEGLLDNAWLGGQAKGADLSAGAAGVGRGTAEPTRARAADRGSDNRQADANQDSELLEEPVERQSADQQPATERQFSSPNRASRSTVPLVHPPPPPVLPAPPPPSAERTACLAWLEAFHARHGSPWSDPEEDRQTEDSARAQSPSGAPPQLDRQAGPASKPADVLLEKDKRYGRRYDALRPHMQDGSGRAGAAGRLSAGDVARVGSLRTACKGGSPPRSRDNLVITTVGDISAFRGWLVDHEHANWDLVVVYWGNFSEAFVCTECVRVYHARGAPWRLRRYVTEQPEWADVAEKYNYIFMPDDDLNMTMCEINGAFDAARRYGLLLSQPSMCDLGVWVPPNIYTRLQVQRPEYALRYVTIVSIQAPIFRMDFFQNVVRHTMQDAHFGWALEWIWPFLLRFPDDKVAIIDEVCVRHPAKLQPRPSVFSAPSPVSKEVEMRRRVEEWGYPTSDVWNVTGYPFMPALMIGMVPKPNFQFHIPLAGGIQVGVYPLLLLHGVGVLVLLLLVLLAKYCILRMRLHRASAARRAVQARPTNGTSIFDRIQKIAATTTQKN